MDSSFQYVPFSDIDKQLATGEPLFIRNTTTNPTKILVVNYSNKGEASPRGFQIPRTSIPFNICDYVSPEALRNSESFRRMLNYGAIEVVEPKRARAELADPERLRAFRASFDEANNIYKARASEAEKTRRGNANIREEQQKKDSAGMKNIIQAMNPELAKAMNIVGPDGQRTDPKLLEQATPNPRLNALEARVKSGALDEQAVLTELSLMLGDLKVPDLTAIAANPHWPPAAQDWARDRVSFLMRQAGKE